MPIIPSSYTPPPFLANGNALTLWASLCRPVPPLAADRIRFRLDTPDQDFVDVDYIPAAPQGKKEKAASRETDKAIVLSHGLEGHSRRPYMLAASAVFHKAGWDVFARNMRSCSGEMNRAPALYHSGETNDLHLVVSHVASLGYNTLALAGFSMGGNQTLRYLAEKRMPATVKAAVAISVPCDLEGSSVELSRPSRAPYMAYFMRTLKRKMRLKHAMYPDLVPLAGHWRMRNFEAFDTAYTAPLYGFASAHDYWHRASSLESLPHITVPTLLINAQDDPFLSPSCYPADTAGTNPALYLEMPKHGGHVGFVTLNTQYPWGPYWSDTRALDFIQSIVR